MLVQMERLPRLELWTKAGLLFDFDVRVLGENIKG